MRKMKKMTVGMLLMMCVLATCPLQAFGALATESTQILNNIELAIQTAQDYADQITNLMKLPESVMNLPGGLTSSIESVMKIYNEVQGILERVSNLDEELLNTETGKLFSAIADGDFDKVTGRLTEKGSKKWEDFPTQYWESSERNRDAMKKALEVAGVELEDLDTDSDLLKKLNDQASTAKGASQLADATNQYLSFMNKELVAIRGILARQEARYVEMAMEARSLKDAQKAILQDDLAKIEIPAPVDVKMNWGKW